MIRLGLTYLATLLPFLLIDAVWLSLMASRHYRPTLGDMALDGVRWAPAILFYLLYPVGIMVFAVLPGLRDNQPGQAALLAALLGLCAYGTYDLTNHATLRLWSWQFTLVDMVWGASVSALAAFIACQIIGRLTSL